MTGPAGTRNPDFVLEARGLHRFFRRGDEEIPALRDVSLAVAPGELVAVVGPSGSGKSTLLNLLAGLDDPDGGSVWLDGERFSHRGPASIDGDPVVGDALVQLGLGQTTASLVLHLDVVVGHDSGGCWPTPSWSSATTRAGSSPSATRC